MSNSQTPARQGDNGAPATQDRKPALEAGGGQIDAIVPRDVDQAYRLSKMIVAAGLAPQDAKSPEEVMGRVVAGLEVGLKPLQAVQSIAMVNGRPVIWGDGLIALVKGSGLCQYITEWHEGQGDDLVAVCETQRVGEPYPTRRTFSVADARSAGLWGKQGPWKQYGPRMLQMRARSWALRDTYPDVLKGIAVGEEARDTQRHQAERAARGGQDRGTHAAQITAAARGEQPAQPEPQTIEAETVEPEHGDTPAPAPDQPAADGIALYGPDGDEIGRADDHDEARAELEKQVQRAPGRVEDLIAANAAIVDDDTAKGWRALAAETQEQGTLVQ